MRISELTIYRTKNPPPGLSMPTLVNQLREVDDELLAIRNNRKELRAKYQKLLVRRQTILAGIPESERPKPGRPKKK